MKVLLRQVQRNFATLAIAEHNGKALSKNTLKLLTAANKLKDEVISGPHRPICWFADNMEKN
jgi:hypothetical protein